MAARYIFTDQIPDFFYKESDFPAVNLSEILKKNRSEEMFQFIDVYAGGDGGGGYIQLSSLFFVRRNLAFKYLFINANEDFHFLTKINKKPTISSTAIVVKRIVVPAVRTKRPMSVNCLALSKSVSIGV